MGRGRIITAGSLFILEVFSGNIFVYRQLSKSFFFLFGIVRSNFGTGVEVNRESSHWYGQELPFGGSKL